MLSLFLLAAKKKADHYHGQLSLNSATPTTGAAAACNAIMD